MTLRTAFSVLLVLSLTALCSCRNGPQSVSTETLKRAEELIKEAKQQYEEGAYAKTYEFAVKAREMVPDDLEPMLLQGWALLQLGRHDDWINPATNSELQGARTILTELLAKSPNEYKATQGLASMDFRDYFDFRRKSEIMRRFAKQFGELADTVPSLRPSAGAIEEVERRRSAFLKNWRVASDKYRELQTSEAALFTDPESPKTRLTGKDWIREELALDQIDYYVRRYEFNDLAPRLRVFATDSENVTTFWDKRALSRLTSAAKQFGELEQRAPEYYHVKHDMALVHLAIGDYFLQKALAEAEADFRKQLPDAKVPASELPEVVADFYADAKIHNSPRREVVSSEFALAAQKIEEYVKADEEFELRSADTVERARTQFATNTDRNAVLADVLGIYTGVVKEMITEKRERRKNLIAYLLMIYIYPKYGNQNLGKAKAWVKAFEDADMKDPVPSFIRGVIFERQGEAQTALEEYNRFLSLSSIAMHSNRREYARGRITALEAELRKRGLDANRGG